MILDQFLLTDRVAIVTAAGRGIGAGIARAFAEAGADLVIGARTEEQLAEVAADVEKLGRRVVAIPGSLARARRHAGSCRCGGFRIRSD